MAKNRKENGPMQRRIFANLVTIRSSGALKNILQQRRFSWRIISNMPCFCVAATMPRLLGLTKHMDIGRCMYIVLFRKHNSRPRHNCVAVISLKRSWKNLTETFPFLIPRSAVWGVGGGRSVLKPKNQSLVFRRAEVAGKCRSFISNKMHQKTWIHLSRKNICIKPT